MTFDEFAENLFLVAFVAWNVWCLVESTVKIVVG